MGIDRNQLQYFIDVAAFRSINKASEHRNIAQPALSRRMSQLEYDLGCELFVRSSQGVDLTPAGKVLLMRAAAIIRQFDDLHDLTAQSDMAQRQLRIGMPPGVSLMLLDQVVRSVYRDIDEVILTIEEEDSCRLLKQLSEGQLDIAVVSRRPRREGLEAEPYFVEPLYFATREPETERGGLPFAVPDADEAFFRIAEEAMTSLGRAPHIDMKLASIASIKRLVEKGQARTLGPYSAFSGELAAGSWTFEKVENPLLYRDLVWRRQDAGSELVSLARGILRSVIGRCAEEGPPGAVVVLSA
ncbi:LysR family transcriptional regulator [Pararhodobacter sp.]|uniref:LysR family transcriptional regulator n=1 Tax=Pararhodobacter sp. TaxID=2127056 RepID=UPI002B003148|nr:LysR family transcriptional regulator [Pararhodobacter sp.]